MLKPRNAYVSDRAYNSALFTHEATVECFAIGPNNGSQIKLQFNNEKTKDCDVEPRLRFFHENDRTRALSIDEAKDILDLIKSVKSNPRVNVATKSGIVRFESSNNDSRVPSYYLNVKFGHAINNVLSSPFYGSHNTMTKSEFITSNFFKCLDRVGEVIKYFLDKVEGKDTKKPESHFKVSNFIVYPLNNKASNTITHSYLRAQIGIPNSERTINSIAFTHGKNTVLFYGLLSKGKNTSNIEEVVEAFIKALQDLEIDFLKSVPDEDTIGYHQVIELKDKLSSDRSKFMEYVSGRETMAPADNRRMIININTESAPSFSKVHFQYDHDFINDLVFALRFLVK